MIRKKIEFFRHNLSRKDINECVNVLNSLFLTTGGYVSLFEKKFTSYLGTKYAVGLTSCTEALFLSLKGLGIGEGDEVITSPLSFIATANAIEHCLAKPVFVDVEELTGNINVNLIEKAITKKTKAIIPVHLYGQMSDMKTLRRISRKYHIALIEDSAHCIEGERDGIKPGQISDAACFSFYATKNMTSGEGGAVATNNYKLYSYLIKSRLHGMSKDAASRYEKEYRHYDMELLGYKSNMNNIQAALLINQLDTLESQLIKKEAIAFRYDKGFRSNPYVKTLITLPGVKHARLLYTILVEPKLRDSMLQGLQRKGVGVAVNFKPIHLMTYYKKKYGYKAGDYPRAEKIGASTISIPFYPKLKSGEVAYVIKAVNELTSAKG